MSAKKRLREGYHNMQLQLDDFHFARVRYLKAELRETSMTGLVRRAIDALYEDTIRRNLLLDPRHRAMLQSPPQREDGGI